MSVPELLTKRARSVDAALNRLLPNGTSYPKVLGEAMRYSVLSGGKRVRPFLVIETAKLFGATPTSSVVPACAVEMIHAYSLVHDDLPAMDDDDFRRGKKTCHKQYDEAIAILVGDALLTQAFQIIAEAKKTDPGVIQKTIQILSKAAGPFGMVGGQAADLCFQKNKGSVETISKVNELKTGALIKASVLMGATWAGAGKEDVARMSRYGNLIGELFQLIDDIHDKDGYVSLIGTDETYRLAEKTYKKAKNLLKPYGTKAKSLISFTDFLYERQH